MGAIKMTVWGRLAGVCAVASIIFFAVALLSPSWSTTDDVSAPWENKTYISKQQWRDEHTAGALGDTVGEVTFGLRHYCLTVPIPNFNGELFDVCFPYSDEIKTCDPISINASAYFDTTSTTSTTTTTSNTTKAPTQPPTRPPTTPNTTTTTMTTTTTTNVSAAVATTLPGTATTTATNTTARRHWRERRAGVPAYIENRTGVFMDTVCTTMTGYDRFSGVYTASTLVEASLGLAIVILIIGACFSEHTKFFAVAFALATILGIVAMSGWANWQNSDGSDFSSSSLTFAAGGWLVVGGWLVSAVGCVLSIVDVVKAGDSRENVFKDGINWQHRLAALLSVVVWICLLLAARSEQWSGTDSLGMVGDFCTDPSTDICLDRSARLGIWGYCVEEQVDYFGKGAKVDVCMLWDKSVTVTAAASGSGSSTGNSTGGNVTTTLEPTTTTITTTTTTTMTTVTTTKEEFGNTTANPNGTTTAPTAPTTPAAATPTAGNGSSITPAPGRQYTQTGSSRFAFADVEKRIMITKTTVFFAVLFAVIADLYSEKGWVGVVTCFLACIFGITSMSAWVTFQIAVGDEGPDMHPKWGTILVILGWLFALIATILFTYRTKKQQDGKSTYQLEDLSGN